MAPTQLIPAIIQEGNENIVRTVRWRLVPSWAEDRSIGKMMINARSETVDSKPSFRPAFKKRRCLIPADGFYEWKGVKGAKQPVYITLTGGGSFGFAGLWEVWDKGKTEEPLYTCTIITTEASPSVKDIHHWMPMILKPEAFEDWIKADTPVDTLKEIIRTHTYKDRMSRPVSKALNSVWNNSADLIEEAYTREGLNVRVYPFRIMGFLR